MLKRTMTLLGASALLFSSAELLAQNPPAAGAPRARAEGRPAPRPGGMRGEMRPRPARAMRTPGMRGGSPARAMLGMRDHLALTDDQVRRLEALATTQREALRPNEPAMLRARADVMEATRRDDIPAARAAMERMARARTDLAVAHLQARKAARDVLTAEQRAKLQDGRGAMGQGRMMRERRPAGAMRPGRELRDERRPGARPDGMMRLRERRPRDR